MIREFILSDIEKDDLPIYYMDERVENNFINIYKKFDILDKKLNIYNIKIDEINDMIDLIISSEYNKIHKNILPNEKIMI